MIPVAAASAALTSSQRMGLGDLLQVEAGKVASATAAKVMEETGAGLVSSETGDDA